MEEIKRQVLAAERILIVGHQKPDGDCLGALSALGLFLKRQNKDYVLFCRDAVPDGLDHLPLMHEVVSDVKIFSEQFDLFIVVDSGDLKYAGVAEYLPKIESKMIVIDHHISNVGYGDLNLIMSDRSSTCEVLYELFGAWRVMFDKEIATALLNGMIYDTGVFSNAATGLETLKAAAQLLNFGARHYKIKSSFLRDKTLGLLKLWGKAFERLNYNEHYSIAFTALLPEDFIECGVDATESSQGLSNFFNDLTGVKAVLVLTDSGKGVVKGSLRTTRDDIDVSALAGIFGGGGHRKASGFSLPGKLVYNEGNWKIINFKL